MKSLREATYRDILKMEHDNFSVGNWNIMSDGDTVFLSKQEIGEAPTQELSISRHSFNALLKCYEKPRRLGTWVDGEVFRVK